MILKVDHLSTIHAMFALNRLSCFREIFKTFSPYGTMLKLCLLIRWQPSWMEVRVSRRNFVSPPCKDHPCNVCFKLAHWFLRRFLNVFPIGSYVKIMFGHLGWRSGSTDTILKLQKGDYPKTMPAKFG